MAVVGQPKRRKRGMHSNPGWWAATSSPARRSTSSRCGRRRTFDPETIERELGWAAAIGFNTVRVFLHDLLWQADAEGFKTRIDRFLELAAGKGIRPMLVLFDDCWNANPQLGKQPAPTPGGA